MVMHTWLRSRERPLRISRSSPAFVAKDLDLLLEPSAVHAGQRRARTSSSLDSLVLQAVSRWIGRGWELHFSTSLPDEVAPPEGSDYQLRAVRQFWGTFGWSGNPWIRDAKGVKLLHSKFNQIAACSIADLHIWRTGPTTYVFTIPPSRPEGVTYSQPKLRRWATAILLASPLCTVGSELGVASALSLRHPPPISL